MVIPARKRVGSTAAKEKIKKLRVADYYGIFGTAGKPEPFTKR